MLATLFLTASVAAAAKIPVIVNIGIGPTIGTIGTPGGLMAPSVGIGLQAEGWVSRRTLRSKRVRRRVPQQYRGMVRKMDDLHVRPLPTLVIPDSTFFGPVEEGVPALRGATWAPLSLSLSHSVKRNAPHWSLAVAPRLAWLNLQPADRGDATNQAWLGASIDPELQSNMRQRVGFAVGGSLGAGWTPEITAPDLGLDGTPWLMVSATARLQLRIPMKINL